MSVSLATHTVATARSETDIKTASENSIIKRMLKIPIFVAIQVIENLPERDLKAFEISLGKGSQLQTEKLAFDQIRSILPLIRQKRNLLTNHPEWENELKQWRGVSLENKIWLLQIVELYKLGIDLPQLQDLSPLRPSNRILELLKQKNEIQEELSKIINLEVRDKMLGICPVVALPLTIGLD